jgi:hypothetical protein
MYSDIMNFNRNYTYWRHAEALKNRGLIPVLINLVDVLLLRTSEIQSLDKQMNNWIREEAIKKT